MSGTVSSLAEPIAREAHAGQVDKAGQPYVGHLERVVAHLRRRHPGATEEEVAVVGELSKPQGTAYLPWVRALAARGSLSAVRVKLVDNADNTDPARIATLPDGSARPEARYLSARKALEERLT